MAHHCHNVAMAARPRAQDAEAVLSVVVGHSFDEARQHFPGVRLRTHADHCISRPSEKFVSDFRLRPVGGLFLFENSLLSPVTKLPHRPKIHENTLILIRRLLKQLFEFSTAV